MCPPRAVLLPQTLHSGKQLCDGVDHSQIDLSAKGTDRYSMDSDPVNDGYTSDFVLDLPLTVTRSMLRQQRAGPPRRDDHEWHADILSEYNTSGTPSEPSSAPPPRQQLEPCMLIHLVGSRILSGRHSGHSSFLEAHSNKEVQASLATKAVAHMVVLHFTGTNGLLQEDCDTCDLGTPGRSMPLISLASYRQQFEPCPLIHMGAPAPMQHWKPRGPATPHPP